jgi:hypothetical protein
MKDKNEEDLKNSKKLSEIIKVAKIKVCGTLEEQTDLMIEERERCGKRGYHRVSQDKKDPLVCYDCGAWFSKEDSWWIDYKVEPI